MLGDIMQWTGLVKYCKCVVAGLDLLKTAIEKAGYTGKIKIGMDVAASEFCKDKKYDLDFKNPNSKPADYVSSGVVKLMFSCYQVVLISVVVN